MKFRVSKIKSIKRLHPLIRPIEITYDFCGWFSLPTIKEFVITKSINNTR